MGGRCEARGDKEAGSHRHGGDLGIPPTASSNMEMKATRLFLNRSQSQWPSFFILFKARSDFKSYNGDHMARTHMLHILL
jgi:hypothetical protein